MAWVPLLPRSETIRYDWRPNGTRSRCVFGIDLTVGTGAVCFRRSTSLLSFFTTRSVERERFQSRLSMNEHAFVLVQHMEHVGCLLLVFRSRIGSPTIGHASVERIERKVSCSSRAANWFNRRLQPSIGQLLRSPGFHQSFQGGTAHDGLRSLGRGTSSLRDEIRGWDGMCREGRSARVGGQSV